MSSFLLLGAGTDASAGGGTTFATWNPADVGSNITLTNGNLTATAGSTTNFTGRATRSRTSGLYYYEIHIDVNTAPHLSFGVCDSGLATSGNIFDSFGRAQVPDTAFCCVTSDSILNQAAQSAIILGGAGTTFGVLTNLTSQLVWVTRDGANWQAGGGTFASPGAGFAYTGITAGTALFPAFSIETSGDKITANFGATAYAYGLPSGASNW